MKHLLTLLCVLWVVGIAQSQPSPLTITYCYEHAKQNYPLIKQRELIAQSKDYSLSNAAKGHLPQLTLNGNATYQSAVTSIPVAETGERIPVMSKNQFRITAEVSETLYDGGVVKNEKESAETNAIIEEQKLEVELYKLKDQVNQLFFGILLLDEQLKQNDLYKGDLSRGIQKAKASIANGTALKSSEDILQAEFLKANQQSIELTAMRSAYVEMLGLFIGESLNEQNEFEKPHPVELNTEINRPELTLYNYQYKSIDLQNKMLQTRNTPKLSVFFQGGYGRPGLDMLKNEADPFYVTGARLSWNISNFYTNKNEKELLNLKRNNIEVQKETFMFNTNLTLRRQATEVDKLKQLVATDDEIIALRTRVKNTSAVQLENGVIDTNDYLHEVNAEDQARQNKILHEIQLLTAQYNAQTTSGN
jgi:outer membrane protein TolC